MKRDVIRDLTRDHRKVEALFRRFRTTTSIVGKRRIFDQIRRELSVHAGAEEQVLYPALRDAFGKGDRCADAGIEEHAEIKQTLSELQGMDPASREFDRKVTKLVREVDHHVREEEREIFPRLRENVERKELRELGESVARAKRLAPTRPHPLAPARPPANLVTDAIAGAVDRLRDALMALTEAPPRSAPARRRRAGSARRARTRNRTRTKSRTRRTAEAARKRAKPAKPATRVRSRAKRKTSRRRRAR